MNFLRGDWREEEKAITVTMETWDGSSGTMPLKVRGLKIGEWGIYVNGELKGVKRVSSYEESVDVEVEIGGEERDVVIVAA